MHRALNICGVGLAVCILFGAKNPLQGGQEYTREQMSKNISQFASLPSSRFDSPPCYPTPNTRMFEGEEEGFAARTRTNDQYGLPGWTREQGNRFHKGVDILPVNFEKTDGTVRISYLDPRTGKSFSKREPILVPKDEIYAILDGTVVMTNIDESRSGYGRYVMIEHHFQNGDPFISMYAHLKSVNVKKGDSVTTAQLIGWMGTSSSNPGGRNYLRAIPHCHFEVGRVINPHFSSTALAKSLHPRMLGGMYDPRNIQPYNPIDFLRKYHAKPKSFFESPKKDDTAQAESPATPHLVTLKSSR